MGFLNTKLSECLKNQQYGHCCFLKVARHQKSGKELTVRKSHAVLGVVVLGDSTLNSYNSSSEDA